MEQWLSQHWFGVISTAAYILSVVIHYTKTAAHISTLQTAFAELKEELRRIKDGGIPYACSQHEMRLTKLEAFIQTAMMTIQSDIGVLKKFAEDNRSMIERERELRRDS